VTRKKDPNKVILNKTLSSTERWTYFIKEGELVNGKQRYRLADFVASDHEMKEQVLEWMVEKDQEEPVIIAKGSLYASDEDTSEGSAELAEIAEAALNGTLTVDNDGYFTTNKENTTGVHNGVIRCTTEPPTASEALAQSHKVSTYDPNKQTPVDRAVDVIQHFPPDSQARNNLISMLYRDLNEISGGKGESRKLRRYIREELQLPELASLPAA
tara:strand:- start:2417 stop:3058 length:642 start_codon:yes stop_codon:yes gene_type:complete